MTNKQPIFDRNQKRSQYLEPIVYCPECNERVHAEYVDVGFGPYGVQVDPYHCAKCEWIETGCQAKSCTKERCHSWEICGGRAMSN